MKYVAATFALTVALAFTASAGAFVGRFDTAKIVSNGKAVQVGGPASFDSDEASAVVSVSLTQKGVHANGTSSVVSNDATSWSAKLTSDGTLNVGSANVTATATITENDGNTETYVWSQKITLK